MRHPVQVRSGGPSSSLILEHGAHFAKRPGMAPVSATGAVVELAFRSEDRFLRTSRCSRAIMRTAQSTVQMTVHSQDLLLGVSSSEPVAHPTEEPNDAAASTMVAVMGQVILGRSNLESQGGRRAKYAHRR